MSGGRDERRVIERLVGCAKCFMSVVGVRGRERRGAREVVFGWLAIIRDGRR